MNRLRWPVPMHAVKRVMVVKCVMVSESDGWITSFLHGPAKCIFARGDAQYRGILAAGDRQRARHEGISPLE